MQASQEEKQFNESYDETVTALNTKDYMYYKELSHQLVQIAPDHPSYMYQYAKALLLNKKCEVVFIMA